MRPNPSLERTSTGLALGPRGFSRSSSASRAKRQPGGVRSAQTLGVIWQTLSSAKLGTSTVVSEWQRQLTREHSMTLQDAVRSNESIVLREMAPSPEFTAERNLLTG